MNLLPTLIVALTTWLAPQPAHLSGNLVFYGSQRLLEANAEYHGYDLSPYKDRCGVSAISPTGLGRIYWIRQPGGAWYGPCLAVDVARWSDFYDSVFDRGEVAEVGRVQRDVLGFTAITSAEVFVGACSPATDDPAIVWRPPLDWQVIDRPEPALWPYPAQEWPHEC